MIFRALRHLIATHAILSAIPLREEKSYPDVYFARLPSIDLRTCVEFISRKDEEEKEVSEGGEGERDEELDALLTEQHNRDFKQDEGTKPFWRLVILHSPEKNAGDFTASWVFHHALADGTSALVFHRHFLSALQQVAGSTSSSETTDADVNPIVPSPNTPLLPPLEALHPLPISALFLAKALLGSLFPSWFAPRAAKLWTGAPISNSASQTRACFQSVVLSAATTKALREASRCERTTVTAALQCIVASSLLCTLDAQQYESVKVDGPISLRRFLRWEGEGGLEEQFVNAMGQYGYVHSRSIPTPPSSALAGSTFSWASARAVRAAISRELDKNGRDSVVGLLRHVPDMHKFFLGKVGRERESSFELSNLGVYKADSGEGEREGEGWKIRRMVFSQCPNVAGAAFATSVVTGGDGCAVLGFSWCEGVVEGEVVERVMRRVEREVEGVLAAAEA